MSSSNCDCAGFVLGPQPPFTVLGLAGVRRPFVSSRLREIVSVHWAIHEVPGTDIERLQLLGVDVVAIAREGPEPGHVEDILIASTIDHPVDNLTGLVEAIGAIFPKTDVQLCVVHHIRNSKE